MRRGGGGKNNRDENYGEQAEELNACAGMIYYILQSHTNMHGLAVEH